MTVSSTGLRITSDVIQPDAPASDPARRSRRDGIVPAILMATVVAGPSGMIAASTLRSVWFADLSLGWSGVLAVVAGPALLLTLFTVPALLAGRWPERLTAVRGGVWLLVAALLFLLPGIGLAAREIVELPNLTAEPDRPVTISTWVVGSPDVTTVLATVIGTVLIAGLGALAGYWSRERHRYAAVAMAAGMILPGVVALLIYAVVDFGTSLSAHADVTPPASLLSILPVVTWLAAPATAMLAGAELRAEVDRS